jgi:hypothetical protein
MRAELEKSAQEYTFINFEPNVGPMEKNLPWYGVTAGSVLGGAAGAHLVPKKYQLLGTLGGGLLGTAVGLHGGEALGRKIDLAREKTAEEVQVEDQAPPTAPVAAPLPPSPAWTLAKHVAGLGLGTAAGYAGMRGADALIRRAGGAGIPRGSALQWAIPLVTGAGGLAYSHLQQRTLDKMREDHLKRQEMKRDSKST